MISQKIEYPNQCLISSCWTLYTSVLIFLRAAFVLSSNLMRYFVTVSKTDRNVVGGMYFPPPCSSTPWDTFYVSISFSRYKVHIYLSPAFVLGSAPYTLQHHYCRLHILETIHLISTASAKFCYILNIIGLIKMMSSFPKTGTCCHCETQCHDSAVTCNTFIFLKQLEIVFLVGCLW